MKVEALLTHGLCAPTVCNLVMSVCACLRCGSTRVDRSMNCDVIALASSQIHPSFAITQWQAVTVTSAPVDVHIMLLAQRAQ